MRWVTLLFTIHYFISPIFGQPGFNRKYDLDESLALFFQCAYVGGDTIAAYGVGYSNEVFLHQQGLLFAQFDTNGNEINHRFYFDSLGQELTTTTPASFLKLQDSSGFLLVGQIINTPKTCLLLKIDNEGNLISRYEFPDSTSAFTKNYYKVIESGNSFYIAGITQKSDYRVDLFVLRVDKMGRRIWDKNFGVNTETYHIRSLLCVNQNEIVLGAVSGPFPTPSNPPLNTQILAIDSLGNIKWSWKSPASLAEDGPIGLYKSEDGFWCYTSKFRQFNSGSYYQPEFIKRDSNFNLVFRNRVDKVRNYYENNNIFNCSFQTQDKGWFAAGQSATIQEFGAFSGMTYRLDSTGEVLWSRFDTAQAPTPGWGCDNQLYAAVELPSGSIIACGYSDRLYPKSWGWLLKIDRNGCVDTLNCMPVSTIQQPEYARQIKVYPNPASDFIHIDVADAMDFERYEIVSAAGRLVDRGEYMPQIPVSDLPPGAYMLRLFRGEEVLCRKVIKM